MTDAETLTTPDGIDFLRTPEERFAAIDDYPYEPRYAMVEGLRMAYVMAGPDALNDSGAATILLLHGEPTWGYLYRKMIPVLAGAGHRVMVPDLIGFGRSDKPVERSAYTYAGHVEWMRSFLEATAAERGSGPLNLFGQDWGGLIGLRLAAEHPELFDRLILANTALPVGDSPGAGFDFWRQFSQEVPFLDCGRLVDNATATALSEAAVDAYRAPFPEELHMAGARQFPMLVPVVARRSGRARQPGRLEGPVPVDQAGCSPCGRRAIRCWAACSPSWSSAFLVRPASPTPSSSRPATSSRRTRAQPWPRPSTAGSRPASDGVQGFGHRCRKSSKSRPTGRPSRPRRDAGWPASMLPTSGSPRAEQPPTRCGWS